MSQHEPDYYDTRTFPGPMAAEKEGTELLEAINAAAIPDSDRRFKVFVVQALLFLLSRTR